MTRVLIVTLMVCGLAACQSVKEKPANTPHATIPSKPSQFPHPPISQKLVEVAWTNSSKLEGHWSVDYLKGLDEAYAEVEKTFADKGEEILWETGDQVGNFNGKYKTYNPKDYVGHIFTVRDGQTRISIDQGEVIFDGDINNGIESLVYNNFWPGPLGPYQTSLVRDFSGETEPKGPAPYEVARSHYNKMLWEMTRAAVSDDGTILTYYDVNEKIIARLKRKLAAAE